MIEAPPPRASRQAGALASTPGLGPMSDRFAALWRRLDGSLARHIWPFLVGGITAGLALVAVRSLIVAAAVALVAVGLIGGFGRSVARRLEELDRISD